MRYKRFTINTKSYEMRKRKKKSLFICIRFYIKSMSLSCNHLIEAKMKIVNQDFDRIFIANVDSHWRFKKFEFDVIVIKKFDFDTTIIVQCLNNFMRNENDKKIKNIDRKILDSSTMNENFDLSKSKFETIFWNVKRNAHIERFFSNFQNSIDEKIENVKLINVNEFRIVKFKNRSKNSKNKKFVMIRASKIAIKSTRRNFFEFEYVEIVVEIFQKREREIRKRESRKNENFENEKFEKNVTRMSLRSF